MAIETEGNTTRGLSGERLTEHERWAFARDVGSPEHEKFVSMQVVSSGSMIEAIGGAAGVVLTILALANVVPGYLVPIAAIVLGAALIFEGGSIASRFWQLPTEVSSGMAAAGDLTNGMVANFLAGVAGVVLGILTMLGMGGATLIPVSVVAFGAALVLGCGLTARFSHVGGFTDTPSGRMVGRVVAEAATGTQILCGVGAVILGIFSLVGVGGGAIPPRLACIGLLVVGSSLLLTGSAIAGKLMTMLYRHA